MRKRVWLYLTPPDVEFLDSIGCLTGCVSRHEQIKFAIKLLRLLIPDPMVAWEVIPQLVGDISILRMSPYAGPSERAWVYLDESDLLYIDLFNTQLKESRGKGIRFLIRLLRLALPNTQKVLRVIEEAIKRKQTVVRTRSGQP